MLEKTADGCWLWTGSIKENGYGVLSIRGVRWYAHRYSYTFHKGPIRDGLFVCHSCDNRRCLNPDHLWLGTVQDNMADMAAKGRAHKGPSVHSDAHPLSKLKPDQARAIRADTRPARLIAPEYGISTSLVWAIRKGRCWNHV